ncbi:hypothetical protein NIES267_04310 [Calothrix parasitica NIES-267]|uniref:Uncharacterized protein n=1 Tax=Calothrix parasitica NIES-267 TaxID=1973488 RepID=A0A1Z4LIA3_9CYAN|nr:hypothetical protein NIES267_04310 [Calothrix parasitica NIES-267]
MKYFCQITPEGGGILHFFVEVFDCVKLLTYSKVINKHEWRNLFVFNQEIALIQVK